MIVESGPESDTFEYVDDGPDGLQEAVVDGDEHHSSSTSGSEYGGDGPESEDSDEVVELENDEPVGKKQKKGLMGRDQIKKIRRQLSSEVTTVNVEQVGQKRKSTKNQQY
jgi:hypothetical protein